MNWNLEKAHWPHAWASRFLRVSPHQWHVQVMGPDKGQAPTLLLLHGAGASLHSFADLMDRLAPRFRLVAVDLPGHGFTTKGSSMRSSLDAVAEDLTKLLVKQDLLPDAIIGHSAGAAVGLELTTRLPTPPRGLVALNGAFAEFDGVAGWLFPMLAKMLALNPFTALVFANTTTPRSVRQLIEATGSELTEAQLGLYFRLVRDRAHVSGALAMMSRWDLRPLNRKMPNIDTPALLLTGARDKAVAPQVSIDAARKLPNATTRTLPALGHLMHEERPDLIAAEIEGFLAGLDLHPARSQTSRSA
ncbi:magnesium-chelatase 30 kDa subunit [Dinoroseobacter shibae DFL 12 = DSM 16493]|jgi:magnesium chelatase accessory protein|uniref:Magnesium-chelatase 30 kDa subunit n=1 Tax=Dinoroseobacter shibae (strain DSM 16493 / NCIMB 14021 / DFL 12) TaxID=398580 RepID=A8LPZ7_DINSH|nr:alpha/beta fold hydrolase BchO [Dinoroseobacter shibae]ABV95237.1 magnesium-chelatase 30 kDa subunit [Dinoroseobacter shibae DFL 12 = DSM 16493]URF46647.1 alpha/beta fold hydrolase [Dinoroseobacter shibae]URF50953.1 alpha/beta fold hydrolase [Dinoroseobacter shibae]